MGVHHLARAARLWTRRVVRVPSQALLVDMRAILAWMGNPAFCPSTCAPPDPDVPEITGGCDPDDASKLPYTLELYDAEGDGWRGALSAAASDALRGGLSL